MRLQQIAPPLVSALLLSIASDSTFSLPAFSQEHPPENPPIAQILQQEREPTVPPATDSAQEVFLVGINIGSRNVTPAAPVRGLTDDVQAVELSRWQIPTSDLFPALSISVNVLEDGQLELISPGLVTRIDADVLTIDPELGQVISVSAIESLLGVPISFDVQNYALVLAPPWANQRQSQQRTAIPIITAGLPTVAAPRFSLSAIRQETTLSTRNNRSADTQGTLSATGSVLGGSWYARTSQPDVTDSTTWRLQEAQYLRQTEQADYVVGSQPTFWPNQSSRYWGLTTVQRFGFEAEDTNRNGFSPSQRMQSRDLARTLVGEAAPGTLVRLVSRPDNEILDEVLVDSFGQYRFDAVSTEAARFSRLLLYPGGQLSLEPEVRRPEFLTLPGQLSAGTSAVIASVGVRSRPTNSWLDQFGDITGGAAYRWGVIDSLTVGLGAIYDESPQGLAELFYQPTGLPLQVAISATSNGQNIAYDANVLYRPSDQFYVSLNSSEQAQRLNASWRVTPSFRLNASGNTSDSHFQLGASGSLRYNDLFLSGSSNVDMTGSVDWTLNARWQQLQLYHRRDLSATSTALNYSLARSISSGHSTFVRYDTHRASSRSLLQAGWRYRSRSRSRNGQDQWRFSLGYGVGSERSGLIASTQLNLIPGISLEAYYEEASLFSDDSTFRIELSPSLGLQPSLALSDTQPEDIRNEGTILVQPFFDSNANGIRDPSEQLHTEELDLLLLLNHQRINQFQSEVTSQGMVVRTEPGLYRLDLDPAGYLIDWSPSTVAYAIEVVAGGQTLVSVPLVQSYAVSGVVRDSNGKPIAGAVVKAISERDGSSTVSITNQAGVFFLERLKHDVYQLSVNDEVEQPQRLELDEMSPSFQQLDFLVDKD